MPILNREERLHVQGLDHAAPCLKVCVAHIDPLGHVHVCQGISIGNVFEMPLRAICERYDPETHPITGPLLAGGPAELVRRYELPHERGYADACHLCYEAREMLRRSNLGDL